MRRIATACALAVLLTACGKDGGRPSDSAPPRSREHAPPPGARFAFVDVGRAAGLTAPTWCGRPGKPHLCESGGAGLALLDYDGDGDLDLYVVNGWRLQGTSVAERGVSRLYRNRGDGTFEDVTGPSGAGLDVWGCGVAVGDPDGDGDPDLFVTAIGRDVLLENLGDGTFRRLPDPPGLGDWSTGAAFFDADGDGDQDLYVAGYVHATMAEVLAAKPTLDWKGTKVMFGPFGLHGVANRYFRNDGHLHFTDATREAGLVDVGSYYSFGVSAVDLDGDGDLDLYVANDSNPNYLYRNDGKGHFEEMGLWSGAALSVAGAEQASMGIAVGDYDGDGRSDLLTTNFAEDSATLFRNRGGCRFDDVTAQAGLAHPTERYLQWGAAFCDLDLDGDLDLVLANGHIYPQADTTPGSGTTYAMRNQIFENRGGRYRDVTDRAGPGFAVRESTRGLAVGDLDGDGDLDLVFSNIDAPPTLLRNDSPHRGAWLLIDAPGSRRAEVTAGGRTWVRDRVAGESFLSAHDPRFHFGLGPVARADEVRILWPDGSRSVQRDVALDRVLHVHPPGR
jgi:hypothetical protein